jgi:hypothetical protein
VVLVLLKSPSAPCAVWIFVVNLRYDVGSEGKKRRGGDERIGKDRKGGKGEERRRGKDRIGKERIGEG